MKALKALFKKELFSYFNAPIAYVFAVVFLLVVNGLFMSTFFLYGLCDMRGFFQILPLALLVFVPALTMRLWAEERKAETLTLLYTLPSSGFMMVLAKTCAALLFLWAVLVGTFVIPAMLAYFGEPDFGPIISGYLGVFLLTIFLVCLGQALSAFFVDQIVAFILALSVSFSAYLLGTNLFASSLDSWLPGVGSFLREAWGILPHFSPFAKGVIPLADVIFFLSFALVFFIINVFTINGFLRHFNRKNFWLGSGCLLCGVLLLNASLAKFNLPRFDLTEGKIYTVSPAARKVLARLKVPIKVTYYVSSRDELPAPMKNIARDVEDVLAEFAALSPFFKYQIVTPKDPSLVAKLKQKGIEPFAVQTIEKDEVTVKRIYSAISISYLDKREEIIPQVVPETLRTLEYEIISRIYHLTIAKKPVVALYTPPAPSSMFLGAQDEFQFLRQVLESVGLEIKEISLTKESPIPEDASLLFVLAPRDLNERQLFEIEKFLREGKPVIIAAQGFKYSYNLGDDGEIVAFAIKQPLKINALLKNYGVEIDERELFDEQSATLTLSIPRRIGLFTAVVQQPVRFPMQIKVLPPQMNQHLSVTSNLSGLLYLWGSALKINEQKLKENKLKLLYLFRSSPQSWLRPYSGSVLRSEDLAPGKDDEKGPFMLAALIKGVFPLSFKEVPPWPGEKKENTKQVKNTRAKTATLALIGSSEMFADTAIQAMGNAIFLANLAESLTLGEDLLYIRAKTQVQRYLPEVSDAQKLAARVIVLFVPPALWVSFGLIYAWRRRTRRGKFLRRSAR